MANYINIGFNEYPKDPEKISIYVKDYKGVLRPLPDSLSNSDKFSDLAHDLEALVAANWK